MGDLEPKGVELMPKPHPLITHSPENDKFGLRVRGSGGTGRRPAFVDLAEQFSKAVSNSSLGIDGG